VEGWDAPVEEQWQEQVVSTPETLAAGQEVGTQNIASFLLRSGLEQAANQHSELEQSFQDFQIGDLEQKPNPILGLELESYQSPSLHSEFFSVSSCMDSATLTDLDELMKSELQKL
jgi:hypothetical protein